MKVVFVCSGGPHSHFAAEWNVTAAALTKLGFAVLMGQCHISVSVISANNIRIWI